MINGSAESAELTPARILRYMCMRNFLSPPVYCSNFNNIINAQINAPGIYLILEAQAREFNR